MIHYYADQPHPLDKIVVLLETQLAWMYQFMHKDGEPMPADAIPWHAAPAVEPGDPEERRKEREAENRRRRGLE